MSPKLQLILLRFWHAWLAGGFAVAYVTADEDTYAMHQFAGYAVLAAIVVRLLAALMAPSAGPLRLPRPNLRALLPWTPRKGRNPLFAWFAVVLLALVGTSAALGVVADFSTWMEDPHEAVSEASLWVIGAHVGFVFLMFGGKRLLARIADRLSPSRPTLAAKESV